MTVLQLPDEFLELPPGPVREPILRELFEGVQRNFVALAQRAKEVDRGKVLGVFGAGGLTIEIGVTPNIPASGVESNNVVVTHHLGAVPKLIYVQPFFPSGDSGRWTPFIRRDTGNEPTATQFSFFMRDAAGSGAHGPGVLSGTPYAVIG